MRILALNAHHGGSHRAFLDGWASRSRHEFDVLALPPHKWKWRMRHAAITFADRARERLDAGRRWDAIFCTDMLNLAEFRGLCPSGVRDLPAVAYFHENQFTYPVRHRDERDLHFGFNNVVTALAADRVWFNSAYHRDVFPSAAEDVIRRMPDHQPLSALRAIREKSDVQPPGIVAFPPRGERRPGPLRVLWVSRWEHDKAPETFFAALDRLIEEGVDFRVSVLGESFAKAPECFAIARERLAARIDHWGFVEDVSAYRDVLREADVVVSTARHEFFGIAIVEAASAGCVPLVPKALAYPEVFGGDRRFLYDGTSEALAARLRDWASSTAELTPLSEIAVKLAVRFDWATRVDALDAAIGQLLP